MLSNKSVDYSRFISKAHQIRIFEGIFVEAEQSLGDVLRSPAVPLFVSNKRANSLGCRGVLSAPTVRLARSLETPNAGCKIYLSTKRNTLTLFPQKDRNPLWSSAKRSHIYLLIESK